MKLNYENVKLSENYENQSFEWENSTGFPPYIRGNALFREKIKFIHSEEIEKNIKKVLNSAISYKELVNYLKNTIKTEENSLYLELNGDFFEENPLYSVALLRAMRGIFSVISKQQIDKYLQLYFLIKLDEKNIKMLPFIIGAEVDFIITDMQYTENHLFMQSIDVFAGSSFIETETQRIMEEMKELL
ncbi:MAG: hypothetical protein Q3983_08655 [Capnocytophaga sp.]|nr:hypothetical protein [Capnocytophaga sp.]